PVLAFTVTKLVILTRRHELEHRMAVRLSHEVLHRGVLARLEVRSRGWGEADVSLEDGPGLVRGDLSDGIVTGMATAGPAHPPPPPTLLPPRPPPPPPPPPHP